MKRIFTILFFLTASLGLLAQARAGSTTYFTFSTGLYGGTTVQISAEGNIVGFESPSGFEHIRAGTILEGYILCYDSSQAEDVGDFGTGFGAPTPGCGGDSCTILRDTLDGTLRLIQLIQFDPETNTVTVDMTISNQSSSVVNGIVLRRYADFDIDSAGSLGSGAFQNYFEATTENGVTAWNEPTAAPRDHAMTLRNVVGPVNVAPHVAKISNDPLSCSPPAIESPVTPSARTWGHIGTDGPADYSASIEYNIGSLDPGDSTSATVQYTRR